MAVWVAKATGVTERVTPQRAAGYCGNNAGVFVALTNAKACRVLATQARACSQQRNRGMLEARTEARPPVLRHAQEATT